MPITDALLDVALRQAQAHDEVLVDAYQELLAYRLMTSQLFILLAAERQRRKRLRERLKSSEDQLKTLLGFTDASSD